MTVLEPNIVQVPQSACILIPTAPFHSSNLTFWYAWPLVCGFQSQHVYTSFNHTETNTGQGKTEN